jgi:hypothetical protein
MQPPTGMYRRFEAEYPNQLWQGDACHGLIGKQDTVFRLGTYTFFRYEGTQTIFEYVREENQRMEYTFKDWEQLYSGDNLKLTLNLYNFSRREVLGTLKRVLKSAKRHHKLDGSRGCLDFVKDYI